METASKIGIHTDTPPRDSKKLLSARPPSHSGKIKLQLFPIDETIQKILQQEKHNPYLELILAPRKKISSVVQHLNTKWGNAQCTKGELILFPNDTRLDNVAVSEKWTIKDSCVAADVHVAVGSPSTFRLRYGWFGPNLEQQISESSLASVHIAGSTIVNKASDLVFSDQKQMVAPSEFPNNFVKPSTADNTNTIQAVVRIKSAPSQDSKQLPSHNNSGLQQIPVTCDSFDAAIASLIARQQGNNQPRLSNPSLWEAEETCHAFSFQNQTKRTSNLAPGNSSGTATASVLGVIPEMGTDDQQCSIRGGKEELNTQTPESINNHNAKPDSTELHESTGDPEIGSSCSRLLSGTESLGLTDLLTNSMDAFQNFSIF
ncbi:hypothetical protein PR202_ga23248 [Eleusine coracana subsp. coracana]|uniref:TSL-kinase interacting protein 1 n=1 Tax=Eleusine coracana subsp. coracana TaxID=191504 RepID=A0AAV5D627_ELECO|nr:hypothetical protein PR202_ga23248 [Eleusine coracana subsp. coracana]